MEEDASGEWPDLEKEFLSSGLKSGPEPFANVPENQKKKRIYSILDSDLSRPSPANK